MKISSKNFVNINISNIDFTSVSTTREVCVLIDNHDTSDTEFTNYDVGTNVYFSSKSDYLTSTYGSTSDILYNKYIRSFFDNGGKKLHYIKIAAPTSSSETDINNAVENFVSVVSELPNEEIIITSTCDNSFALKVAKELEKQSTVFEGINEKLLISYIKSLNLTAKACKPIKPLNQPSSQTEINNGEYYTRDNPFVEADPQPASQSDIDTGDYYEIVDDNYVIATVYDNSVTYYTRQTYSAGYLCDGQYTYSPATTYIPNTDYYIMEYVGNNAYDANEMNYLNHFDGVDNLVVKHGPAGIEMTIGAYLTTLDINRGAIADYCYTEEFVDMFNNEIVEVNGNPTFVCIPVIEDNDEFNSLKPYHINCDMKLTSIENIMSYGGNKTNGFDLVNDYMRIILTQTLTGRLLNVLKSKIRYNQYGLSSISSAIVNELEKYKSFGYISTNKIWTEPDLYDKQDNLLIISKGTPLTQGYVFKILPFESLSEQDRKNHILPEIYLVYSDSYSVRVINLTGYVF